MKLPEWTEAGLLPPGIHRTELPDIYERFVLDAPDRPRRELLFSALSVYMQLLQTIVPAGVAWIDGSFCTCCDEPPHDVDVVVKPADWLGLKNAPKPVRTTLYTLLTLQHVHVASMGVELPRMQPVGGTVDAFLCYPGQDATWHDRWSSVLDAAGNVVSGKAKGFAEVAW